MGALEKISLVNLVAFRPNIMGFPPLVLTEIAHMNMKRRRIHASKGEPALSTNTWLWIGSKFFLTLPWVLNLSSSFRDQVFWKIYQICQKAPPGRVGMNGSPERSEGKKVFKEEAPPRRARLFTVSSSIRNLVNKGNEGNKIFSELVYPRFGEHI